jgi:hypothetical protein
MRPPRLRLSTAALLVVIVALLLALYLQVRRGRLRERESLGKLDLVINKLELMLVDDKQTLRKVVTELMKERSAK